MKRNRLLIFAFLPLLILGSCKDFLNVKPANVLSINTFDDVRSLMGAHLKMYTEGEDGRRFLQGTSIPFFDGNDYLITYFYGDNYSVDNYLDSWLGRNNRAEFYKSLDWRNPDIADDIWSKYYSNIGFYNMILHQIGLHHNASKEEIEQVKSEAKFLRAWCFFNLVELFSPYHQDKYGLPLNTDSDAVGSYDKSRKTQTENYKFIISELNEIMSYKAKPLAGYNIFYDKRIVAALLAEVYLYKGDSGAKSSDDYDNAIKYAKMAMDGRLKLDIVNRNPKETDNFGMKKDEPYALLSFIYYSDMQGNVAGNPAWGVYEYASKDLYSLFPDNDKRKKLYFEIQGKDERGIIKFNSDFQYDFYKWDFFTAAEMQLIIAESYARKKNDADALNALNEFTKYRYDNYVLPVGKSLLQNILDERRKEFCFEYMYRWVDLTRLQTGYTRKALDKKDKNLTYTLKDGDYRFCMPIPKRSELDNNKIPQNPGWGLF